MCLLMEVSGSNEKRIIGIKRSTSFTSFFSSYVRDLMTLLFLPVSIIVLSLGVSQT